MKVFKFFAGAALMIAALASCEKPEPLVELAVTSSEITVPVTGGEQPISFTATEAWTAASDVEWITLDKAEGAAGAATIKATVAANDTYADRSGKITVTMGEKSFSVTVKQTELEVFASVVTYSIDSKAQTIVYEVNSNMTYTATVDEACKDWMAAAVTKGEPADGKINIQVTANDRLFPREGKVYITVGNVKNCVVIRQSAAFTHMTEAAVAFIGRTDKIYDKASWAYLYYNQYVLTLENDETQVRVVLNYDDETTTLEALPEGEFEANVEATPVPGTFSLKSLTEEQKYYTMILDKASGREILPVDGTVRVEENEDGGYTVVITFADEAGNVTSYAYEGSLGEIADEGYGWQVYHCNFQNTYFTHFASGANQWNVAVYASCAPDEDTLPLSCITFYFYGPAGEVDMTNVPDGTYEFEVPETDNSITISNNGKLNARPFTFTGLAYLYTKESTSARNFEWTGGTVTVSHNAEGETVLDMDLTCVEYTKDESWNNVYGEEEYTYKVKHAIKLVGTDAGMAYPELDGDVTLPKASAATLTYMGYYLGDAYGIGATTAIINFNGNDLAFAAVDDGSYTFETNFYGRYCNTPFTAGHYEYSEEAKKMSIVPVKQKSYSCYNNSYTGTYFYICGGSMDLSDNSVTLNLKGKSSRDGSIVNITGSWETSCYYLQDYSSRANLFEILVP